MQELFLRKVTMADAKLLLDWRNESSVRNNSFHSEIIAYEDHVNWLTKKIADPSEIMQILMLGDTPVGQIRLSKDNEGFEISYSLDKEFRGRGYGKEIIRLAERELLKLSGCCNIRGLVKADNKASRQVFRTLGYREYERKDFFEYTKILGQIIFIRADMNPVIATGHMMRCLSIADEIRNMGGKAVFVTADENAVDLIRKRGYEVLVLHSDWMSKEDELPGLIEKIREYGAKKILVDSYQVTGHYLQELRRYTQVTYLDDLDDFPHPADNLICYANYYHSFSYGNKTEKDGYYLGTAYVPLRAVFADCPVKRIRKHVKKILLLSGGNDSCHVIERMVEAFCENKEVMLITICGRYYAGYGELKERYKEYPNLRFHRNVTNIKKYMQEADLAVSAGGTTLYELCAVGTPAISYSFADNQLYNVKQFDEDGIIEYAGDARYEDIAANVMKICARYADAAEVRAERSLRMQQAVDGKGAGRIAGVILSS